MAASKTARVLLIDPSSFLQQGISQALGSTQKYQIEWAQENESALANAKEFDLALLGHGFHPHVALELC